RRGHLPRGQVEREVPRHDGADHPDRLPQRVGEEVAGDGERVARQLIRPARVIAHRLDRHRDVDLRLEQRLAVVLGLDFGELLGALLEQVGEPVEQGAPFAGGKLTPLLGVEAGPGGLDRRIDLRFACLGDLGERLLGGGVGQAIALGRGPPLVADQEVGLHRPLNSATRFSTYAAMPSLASSDWNSCCCRSRSSVRPDSNGTSAPDCTARLIRPTAFQALRGGVNCLAYSMICSQYSSAGKTAYTRPSSSACSNQHVSPWTIIS